MHCRPGTRPQTWSTARLRAHGPTSRKPPPKRIRAEAVDLFVRSCFGYDLLGPTALFGDGNGFALNTHYGFQRSDTDRGRQHVEGQRIAVVVFKRSRAMRRAVSVCLRARCRRTAGLFIARPIFTCPIFSGPIFAGTSLTRTFFTRTVVARPVVAGPVLTRLGITRLGVALIAFLTRRTVFAVAFRARLPVLPGRTIITVLVVAGAVVAILLIPLGTIFALRTVVTVLIVAGTIVTVLARRLFGPVILTILRRAIIARLLHGRIERIVAVGVVALAIEPFILSIAIVLARAIGVRLFIPRAAFGEHAKIMIGELEIIFRQHPVARLLGITRKRFVFFEQLRGIAARAIVDAVAHFGPPSLLTRAILAAPAATAPGLLTIVNQADVVLNKGSVQIPFGPPCVLSYPNRRTISRLAEPKPHCLGPEHNGGKKTAHSLYKSWKMRSFLDAGDSAADRTRQALFQLHDKTAIMTRQILAAIDHEPL